MNTTQSRCAGLVNVRSAPILNLAIRINAVPKVGGGSRYKLTGPGGPEGAPGSTMLHMFLSFPLVVFHCTN